MKCYDCDKDLDDTKFKVLKGAFAWCLDCYEKLQFALFQDISSGPSVSSGKLSLVIEQDPPRVKVSCNGGFGILVAKDDLASLIECLQAAAKLLKCTER